MKTSPISITISDARNLQLRAQGLTEQEAPFGHGNAGVLQTIQQLGYIQVDAVSTIQRAHHHVIATRVPDYAESMLHELQYPETSVFEYWDHAASYLPLKKYRYYMQRMQDSRQSIHWGDDTIELRESMQTLLLRIKDHGALNLSQIETSATAQTWSKTGFGKIERLALHNLMMSGKIMIRSRKGMTKTFDLPDRILPPDLDQSIPSPEESADFFVRRGLISLGLAQIPEWHYLRDKSHALAIRDSINRHVQTGQIIPVKVRGLEKLQLYSTPQSLSTIQQIPASLVHFLSPFDNLVIQRKRLKWLFDFNYTIEIYVPPDRRIFGYFVLPILWGNRLIGRMDVKAWRAESTLAVKNLVFEPTFNDFKDLKPPFEAALARLSRQNSCQTWCIEKHNAPRSFTP